MLYEESWPKWIKITGKLQVTLRVYFLKKLCTNTFTLFGRSNCDAFWENEGKYMIEDVWKSFFHELASWHLPTELHYWLLPHGSFSGILSKWTPSNNYLRMGYFLFLYKILEKHLWNIFLLYVVVEI